jgi:hypothetical protein
VTRKLSNFSFGKLGVHRRVTAALLVGAIGVLGGCAERRVQARNWTNTGEVRPNPPVVRTGAQAGSDDIAPDLAIALPENGTKLFGGRPVPPPRPRVEPPRPSGGTAASKSPTLVPELSPAEAATAQQQFSESVSIAEKNLGIAKTKNLSTIQADTAAKINAFLTEAREASTEGDWGRARNLAKKAQILSEDLAASL